jgi:hypothetical protein
VSEGEDWVDPLEDEYELRVTRQAREDLRVADHSAADLAGMAKASPWGHLTDKFAELRSRDPAGTEAPLSKVHRGDIFKLDGRDGARAVTWHDTSHGVVWLLAFTPEHDFEMMVRRAASPSPRGGASQLLPSVQDYEELAAERGDAWALQRAGEALQRLLADACAHAGVIRRASLAGVVRAEALVEPGAPRRLHLRFRVPPIQSGVLPSGFHWVLPATLTDVDANTLTQQPFPGAPLINTLTISCELL